MNAFKGNSVGSTLMKGIFKVEAAPPQLLCTILTFEHPESKKKITLFPLTNLGSREYLQRALDAHSLQANFDKILCEDGRLPYLANSAAGRRQQFWRKIFPFLSLRIVSDDVSKYDGIIARDVLESQMAYEMISANADPPTDPRARRAVERIDTYPNSISVAMPWSVFHIPYLRYRLLREGYSQVNAETVVMISTYNILIMFSILAGVILMTVYMLLSLLFWH